MGKQEVSRLDSIPCSDSGQLAIGGAGEASAQHRERADYGKNKEQRLPIPKAHSSNALGSIIRAPAVLKRRWIEIRLRMAGVQ